MPEIKSVRVRQIMDSRGNPTVECDVVLDGGAHGRAAVPSGASTGSFEAIELRDADGRSVTRAIANINNIIAPALLGMDATAQSDIDNKMIALDGTENKSNLGANAILAVSLAVAHAAAAAKHIPLYKHIRELYQTSNIKHQTYILPRPMMNIINGGAHADNGLDVQEFMIVPKTKTFADAVRMGAEIFHSLKSILKSSGYVTSVGDEGGFAPHLKTTREALDLIIQAIKAAGYKPGDDVGLALSLTT